MYELALIAAGIIIATLFYKYQFGCKHQWGKWLDKQELQTSTSFNSCTKCYQIRYCLLCNVADTKTISEVSTY